MRRNNRIALFLIAGAVCVLAVVLRSKSSHRTADTKEIHPVVADVCVHVATTGIVEPQNRLQRNPSINGRIEEIFVAEGDAVKKGQILAMMSSTERAALVDAARSQGEETLAYWEEVYKKSSIVAPIDGNVIVRAVEPGQTVTTADDVLILSDRLIVKAQFDETDIGRVRLGQEASISLDAYPDVVIPGSVVHIAYESEVVNNVTIYNVDILPSETPSELRSGMSVTVDIIEKARRGVLTVPEDALHRRDGRTFVLLKGRFASAVERDVVAGLSDGRIVEIVSPLGAKDTVIMKEDIYVPKKQNTASNPFMPARRQRQ